MLVSDVTVLRAGATLALVTLVATIAAGVLIHVADRANFPTIGRGLWWSVQTVTTVGYGDTVPTTLGGRFIAAFVMLTGIAFIAVLTAVVTATFIENTRRRVRGDTGDPTAAKLDEISSRLAALELAVSSRPDENR